MSYGVFRRYPRALPKRQFIPTVAAVAVASLLVSPKIDLTAFESNYNHALYAKVKYLPTKRKSDPIKAKAAPVVIPEISHFRYGARYLPTLAPSAVASLITQKPKHNHSFYKGADYRINPIRYIGSPAAVIVSKNLVYKPVFRYLTIPDYRYYYQAKVKYRQAAIAPASPPTVTEVFGVSASIDESGQGLVSGIDDEFGIVGEITDNIGVVAVIDGGNKGVIGS